MSASTTKAGYWTYTTPSGPATLVQYLVKESAYKKRQVILEQAQAAQGVADRNAALLASRNGASP